MLVGPKGAGKTTLGRFLEIEPGVQFLEVERIAKRVLAEMGGTIDERYARRAFDESFAKKDGAAAIKAVQESFALYRQEESKLRGWK